MDWLDTYLDGLAQYKTTVSPCDTHIWGEKPNLNNQQKRMLFDAAAQSELEYRLIVQEARQAEINAGMGGSYDAGSAAREGAATSAATVPDAPVLTSIGSGNAELSAFFTAPASNGGSIITNYKYSINKGISFTTRSPDSSASPIKITGLTNGTEYDVRIRAVNIIGDGTVSNALSGTPVAPAPSGIPPSTTNILLGGFVTDGFLNINPPFPLVKIGATWFIVNGNPNNPTSANISVAYVVGEGAWFINLQNSGEDGFYYTAATNTAPSTSIPTTGWVLDPSTTGGITITAA